MWLMVLWACCTGASQTAYQFSGKVGWHMGQQVIAMLLFDVMGAKTLSEGPRADTAGWRSDKLLLLSYHLEGSCARRCGRHTSISMKALTAGRCTHCPGQSTPGIRRRRRSASWQEVR